MAKKGKKGKKGAKEKGPEPVTTSQMISDRTKMLCPRMGDVYLRTMQVEKILEDVCCRVMEKALENQSQVLHLSGFKLTSVPNFTPSIDDFQFIRELNLAKNNLFNGEEVFQALRNLGGLLKLNLSNNFLNGMLPNVIGHYHQLEELNLDVNQLTALPPAVGNLSSLKVFSIADNSITAVPPECSSWNQLRSLNIRNNKVTELSNSIVFGWSQFLEKLYCGYNLLQVIPEDLGLCTSLVEIDFSNNSISTIPLAISQCTLLERIHLGTNKISEIPSDLLCSLVHLKELNLHKNKITVIPNEIGYLVELERISLASNNIRSVPEEIGNLENLRELYLSNNAKLSSFPSSGGHLRRLQELSFRKCPALKQLPQTISEMSCLKELDLRAMKKQVCKITPEMVDILKRQRCIIRGGVVKKAKGGKKSKAA